MQSAIFLSFAVIILLQSVAADFVIEIDLKSFESVDGRLKTGRPCDILDPLYQRKSEHGCGYTFSFCIDNNPSNLEEEYESCPTKWVHLTEFNDQQNVKITFNHSAYRGGWKNPYKFKVKGTLAGFHLKVSVKDQDYQLIPKEIFMSNQNAFIMLRKESIVDFTDNFHTVSREVGKTYNKTTTISGPERKHPAIMKYEYRLSCDDGWSGMQCEKKSNFSCAKLLLKSGIFSSGFHQITPLVHQPSPVTVFCDMESHGGGWTVIQRRTENVTDFDRDWSAYKTGFGQWNGSYWLGLDAIHALTHDEPHELLIELEDCVGNQTAQQRYQYFYVSSEEESYRLNVSLASTGSAGDSLNQQNFQNQNRMPFTTTDRDNDDFRKNCASVFKGGWWYNSCTAANLNGKYYENCFYEMNQPLNGIYWKTWAPSVENLGYYSAKRVEMKIRPVNIFVEPETDDNEPLNGDLRVTEGVIEDSEGRLEIFSDGKWYTVCGEMDDMAVTVACRQMGKSLITTALLEPGFFGSMSEKGFYSATNVSCTGLESKLSDCATLNKKLPASKSCTKPIALVCSEKDYNQERPLRLMNNDDPDIKNVGRLEVFYNGQWGSVCQSEGNETDSDVARSVCSKLGLKSTNSKVIVGDNPGPEGSPIWLDNVSCTVKKKGYYVVSSTGIFRCIKTAYGQHSCSHNEDITISCRDERKTIRLAGTGSTSRKGRLEVFQNGRWGSVCKDRFDSNALKVACSDIVRYTPWLTNEYGRRRLVESSQFGPYNGPMLVGPLTCRGDESKLQDCTSGSVADCSDGFAAIQCQQ